MAVKGTLIHQLYALDASVEHVNPFLLFLLILGGKQIGPVLFGYGETKLLPLRFLQFRIDKRELPFTFLHIPNILFFMC